jgi:hypothetical protein
MCAKDTILGIGTGSTVNALIDLLASQAPRLRLARHDFELGSQQCAPARAWHGGAGAERDR